MKLVAKFGYDDYFCEVLKYDAKTEVVWCYDEKFGESAMCLTDIVEIKILNVDKNTRPKEGEIKP